MESKRQFLKTLAIVSMSTAFGSPVIAKTRRVSCLRDDTGYAPHLLGRVTVLLDGEDVTRSCQTADECGYVLLVARNADGRIELTPDRKEVKLIERRGVVNIILA